MTDFEKLLLQKLEEKDKLILSLQSTISVIQNSADAKKLGSNAYEAIKNAVTGASDYIFAGGAE